MEFESDREEPMPDPGSPPWSPRRRWSRWAVNGWLVLHVSAIIIAPASVAPSSFLAVTAWEVVHPYLQLLYLNHGYHFFAPEPSYSTLLEFQAERADGSVIARGRIPDRRIVPRLLYHRHFMLSEHMAGAPEEVRELWHRSFAEHIGRKYGADVVRLSQVSHYLPTIPAVQQGIGLDHPDSYEVVSLGAYRCDEF
ncbi:hypothetical protein [Tautonia sociabilis]|uniref:Uncharacterized protein n=1 Tax=Tautonia sociabilis TaxID=2080755 RepID=A0A432MNU4_9BACT|nr:hypothetical protein [Tautonia sociabilis]RUL88748.1 hypothetical protein TsocGM_05135 [Tautonia sociabilis]